MAPTLCERKRRERESVPRRLAHTGKVIAIQGYEQDQVMVSPVGKPGLNPEKDVSVPVKRALSC